MHGENVGDNAAGAQPKCKGRAGEECGEHDQEDVRQQRYVHAELLDRHENGRADDDPPDEAGQLLPLMRQQAKGRTHCRVADEATADDTDE